MSAATARIAVIDGGSFVLPYDFELVRAMAEQRIGVVFFGSRTRFNGEFLEAMRTLPNVEVRDRSVSGTVASRWGGLVAYAALWREVWRRRREFDAVNLQFSAFWPLELPFAFALRRRFVYTVHNAVPHDRVGRTHPPTRWLAALARRLVFVSPFSRDDFLSRYGNGAAPRSHVVELGVLPAVPHANVVAYRPLRDPEALVFWSTVKPYKGVELFLDLARSDAVRARGLALEIHGAWASELAPLRDELAALGVRIDDRFLDPAALQRLLARDVLFVLPNREATQSGAMQTLVAHGRTFVAADVGDLGAFLRRHGLEALLLRERSADAVIESLDRIEGDGDAIARALQRAQDRSAWSVVTRGLAEAYGVERAAAPGSTA